MNQKHSQLLPYRKKINIDWLATFTSQENLPAGLFIHHSSRQRTLLQVVLHHLHLVQYYSWHRPSPDQLSQSNQKAASRDVKLREVQGGSDI